ncbi:flagellar motor switch protein FliM [Arthrobacter tecti]
MTVQEHPAIGVPAEPRPETAGTGVHAPMPEGGSQEAVDRAPEKPIHVYDFRRPTTLAREHSRVLEVAFETFARQWATQLTAKIRLICQITSEQVLMQSYNEYAASLPPTTAMVLCATDQVEAKAVIQFPAAAALHWIDHMLGGQGSALPGERRFTSIEHALVQKLMDDALEGLHYSLGSLLTTELGFHSVQYNAQFAQAAATADLMIVAQFEIRVGDSACRASVAIPADLLIPQLGEANPTATTENARDLLEAQLVNVPVDVSLQLAPVGVLPSDVLDLAVGDLLSLPHPQHRPLNVVVNGHRLAHAAVGSSGSRLACVVVNTEENA